MKKAADIEDGLLKTKTASWFGLLASLPTALLLLAGCSHGVLDPQGPVGADEKVILFDASAIPGWP